jgi:hypothetical protein
MDTDERRVDGNAAAGLLGEIFPFEMTMVKTLCVTCGEMEPAGAELVYADAPGMVMRCVHCESVLIKLVHGGGRYWLDMRGVACLQIVES